MAWFIGIAQHYHKADEKDPSRTLFHTREEKRRVCDALAENRYGNIPVVIDHAGAEDTMLEASIHVLGGGGGGNASGSIAPFVVPKEKEIGRMAEAFLDETGNLHGVIELFYNRPETRDIIDSLNRNERWGLSLCTDYEKVPGVGRVQNKRISHIGITRNPEYGDDGHTWLYDGSMSPAGLDRIINDQYMSVPGMYVPEATRKRVAARMTAPRSKLLSHTASSADVPLDSYVSSPLLTRQHDHRSDTSGGSSSSSNSSSTTNASTTPRDMDSSSTTVGSSTTILAPGSASSNDASATDINDALSAAGGSGTLTTGTPQHREIVDGLARVNEAAIDFMKKSTFDKQEDFFNDSLFQSALMTKEALTELLNRAILAQVPHNEIPHDVYLRIGQLSEYIQSAKEAMREVVAKTVDDQDKDIVLKSIDNPMAQRPYLRQVMATGNAKLVSMRQAEARIEAEQRYEKLKAEHEQLRKDMETLKQETGGGGMKRARDDIDTYIGRTDAAKRPLTTDQQTQRQQQQQPVAMSAGATRMDMDAVTRFWAEHAKTDPIAVETEQFNENISKVLSHLKNYQQVGNVAADGQVNF